MVKLCCIYRLWIQATNSCMRVDCPGISWGVQANAECFMHQAALFNVKISGTTNILWLWGVNYEKRL